MVQESKTLRNNHEEVRILEIEPVTQRRFKEKTSLQLQKC